MINELRERFELVLLDITDQRRDGTRQPDVHICDLTKEENQESAGHFEGADAIIHCAYIRGDMGDFMKTGKNDFGPNIKIL
jgi:hypothetical protein